MIYYISAIALVAVVLFVVAVLDFMADNKSDKERSFIDPLMITYYNDIHNQLTHGNFK